MEMMKTNVEQSFDMIEKSLRKDSARYVARIRDELCQGVSCYLASDQFCVFFTAYKFGQYDYILEAHLPCKRMDEATKREAAFYASEHVFKNSIRGKIEIEDSEFIFHTEIPIGDEPLSESVFDRCLNILLLEIFTKGSKLLAVAQGIKPKEDDNKELLRQMLREIEECMIIPDKKISNEDHEDGFESLMESLDAYEKEFFLGDEDDREQLPFE